MILPSTRARTVLATCSHVELGILSDRVIIPAHLIDPRGAVLLRPGDGPCWDHLQNGQPCPLLDLVATDITSVPQPDRIRAHVRMRGTVELLPAPPHPQVRHHLGLSTGEPMARFVPECVILNAPSPGDRYATTVPLSAYAEAATDPLAGWEAAWISHLDSQHAQALRRLVSAQLELCGSENVHALQADVHGITVRIYAPGFQRDLRLDFPREARCGCQAVDSFNAMVAQVAPPGCQS